jgi:selenocysteine-specific elongation factor
MRRNLETIFNVVVGTAGHIDHGKSSLVERLTGVHPDRLPEEKARGLTIDLGFAPLTLKSGLRVGIIDVPGHERLVKNMIAGATGIDFVILVIAADDGVMPQTREHIAIMQLLGLEHGMVALTKIDIVEDDLRELVREDIQETLKGTFLENAPLVEVSSVTREGLDRLLETLNERIALVRPRDATGVFRMPIQRVFSSKGFGTVVTGIPVSGQTRLGDTLEVAPLGEKGRVRGIHAYGEPTDLSRAGHSSAFNLSDVDYRAVHRGMVLVQPGYFRGATMFEARFRYLPANPRSLPHQASIRLNTGTAEVLGRIYLLESKKLEPGSESFVQFRLEEPLVAAPGDRFVARSISPLATLGGGEILDQSRWRLKTGKMYVIDALREKADAVGDPLRFLAGALQASGYDAVPEKELAVRAGLPLEETRALVDKLAAAGELRRSSRAGLLLSSARLAEAEAEVLRSAQAYFREHPRRRHLDREQLRQKLASHEAFFQDLVDLLSAKGIITGSQGGKLAFRDFGPKLTPGEEAVRAEILESLSGNFFNPPAPVELAAERGWKPGAAEEIAKLLVEEGEVVQLAEGIYFHHDALEEARRRMREYLAAHGTITASQARTLLESTRKYCIPLLEHLDREGFTLRKGDLRQLRG